MKTYLFIAGFVGFEGTENKRTFLALAQVKKTADIEVEGGNGDFFAASNFVMVGASGDEILPYVKAGLSQAYFVTLMDGADRPELRKELADKHGDPYIIVGKASHSAIQFSKGAWHQGTDVGTFFEEVKFSIHSCKSILELYHEALQLVAELNMLNILRILDVLIKRNHNHLACPILPKSANRASYLNVLSIFAEFAKSGHIINFKITPRTSGGDN
jgi:hypothetical protein